MTALESLVLALAVLGAVLGALVLVVVVGRVWRRLGARRTGRAESVVRPMVVALMAGEVQRAGLPSGQLQVAVAERIAVDHLPKVRGEAREAIVGWLSDAQILTSARRGLTSRGAVRRARAAHLLGLCGDAADGPAIERLLRDRDTEVRRVAVRALGHLRRPESVGPLLDALASRELPAGTTTAALVSVTGDTAPLRSRMLAPGTEEDAATTALTRAVCAEVLGLLGAVEAVGDLVTALEQDRSSEVRIRAARALGRIGSPRAVDGLVGMLGEHREVAERAVAARALGEIGALHSVGALRAALEDPEPTVAVNSGEALARMGGSGRKILAVSPVPAAREALAMAALRDSRSSLADRRPAGSGG